MCSTLYEKNTRFIGHACFFPWTSHSSFHITAIKPCTEVVFLSIHISVFFCKISIVFAISLEICRASGHIITYNYNYYDWHWYVCIYVFVSLFFMLHFFYKQNKLVNQFVDKFQSTHSKGVIPLLTNLNSKFETDSPHLTFLSLWVQMKRREKLQALSHWHYHLKTILVPCESRRHNWTTHPTHTRYSCE